MIDTVMSAIPKHGEKGHFHPPEGGYVPPLKVYQTASHHGTVALWVVFGIMAVSTLVFYVLGPRLPKNSRIFHYITGLITLTAAISYYAMAVQEGVSYQSIGHHAYRQLYWARYVDWAITTPLLLLDLTLLAGMSPIDTITLLVADEFMILTGFFAALTKNDRFSWGFYAISCIFFIFVLYQLLYPARVLATQKGNAVGKLFASISLFTIVIWTLYPIAWGFAEGGKRITVDHEIYVFAILDVLAKPVFGSWLIYAHEKIPEARFKLGPAWTNGLGSEYDSVDDEA